MIARFLLLLSLSGAVFGAPFDIASIPSPEGIDPQVGGMDVRPDGKIAVAFHRGEVMLLDPASQSWSRFAEGLHEPLGVLAESNDEILVMQRAELTRLRDTDSDGRTDIYQTVFDDFGMTGNYHEFAFGPAKGPDGALYISLNVASNGAGIRPEIRGEWSDLGELDFKGMQSDRGWNDRKGKAGRMYSRVPWRGWILRIDPKTGKAEPWASGFRSPDGIGFDSDGRLLVTDNQGDWRGTSPLYVVKKGGFYGHPASLAWEDGWSKGDPRKLPVAQLEKLRTGETARFPQGELANSPTQPVVIPDGWGPYSGQTLIGEMNQPRLVRFLPDEVNGFTQGTLVGMLENDNIGIGNHRLAFTADGSLWIGKTHLSWAGNEGLKRVSPTADIKDVFTVTAVNLQKRGSGHVFRVTFSQPLADGPQVTGSRFSYRYHEDYGSPEIDKATLTIASATVEPDGKQLLIETEAREGAIHRLDLSKLRSRDGRELDTAKLFYQATELP